MIRFEQARLGDVFTISAFKNTLGGDTKFMKIAGTSNAINMVNFMNCRLLPTDLIEVVGRVSIQEKK